MKECNNDYESAMHYDCAVCTEKNCKYRKPDKSPLIVLFWLVLISIIISIIILV